MHNDVIEAKWIDCFVRAFQACKVNEGEVTAILSESQSRPILVKLAELALLRLKARPYHVVVPTPPAHSPVPIRSTGHSMAIQGNPGVIGALTAASFVVDCTVEGLLHAAERGAILAGGTRVFMISNEHPEILERLAPDPGLRAKVLKGVALAKAARRMRVTSKAGTDLTIDMIDANIGGGWGIADEPGRMDYWPGGLCAFYPRGNAVNGVIVMDAGDINLTFKRYLQDPIRFEIENDYITSITGVGMDAPVMRSYFEAWGDRNAYATAHLGWGMNPHARWDSLVMYDRHDTNGTEQRAFAGNFLWSTGSNRFAGRNTEGHFDLPMRNCTITLDDKIIVDEGKLMADLAA
jgi:2,5-dihydroxypyridine 5,6-dioxygenase